MNDERELDMEVSALLHVHTLDEIVRSLCQECGGVERVLDSTMRVQKRQSTIEAQDLARVKLVEYHESKIRELKS